MRTTPTPEATTNAFKVREWRPHSKNTLVGFASLERPSGLIIHNISGHEKANSRWVAMPGPAVRAEWRESLGAGHRIRR